MPPLEGGTVVEFLQAGFVGPRIFLQLLAAHLSVAVYAGEVFETGLLDLARLHHSFAYRRAAFGRSLIGHVVKLNRLNFYLDVYTSEDYILPFSFEIFICVIWTNFICLTE